MTLAACVCGMCAPRVWRGCPHDRPTDCGNAQAYEAMQRGGRGNGGAAFPGAAAGSGYAVGTNQYAVSAAYAYPGAVYAAGAGYPAGGYPGAQHGLMAQASAVSHSCHTVCSRVKPTKTLRHRCPGLPGSCGSRASRWAGVLRRQRSWRPWWKRRASTEGCATGWWENSEGQEQLPAA